MKLVTILLSAALVLPSLGAFAADSTPAQSNDLAPGPAAGVHQAQLFAGGTTTWVAVGVVAAGIIVIAATSGNSHHSATTTTGAVP
jgi:hypothetical protein